MRMLVFPYGHDSEPIIRHVGLLDSQYEIAALVSPGGWGLAGKENNNGRQWNDIAYLRKNPGSNRRI